MESLIESREMSHGVNINTLSLIELQKKVIRTYEFKDETEIEMIDRFAILILDEVSEFLNEKDTKEENLFEFTDIILYLGSILSTIEERFEDMYGVSFKEYTEDMLFPIDGRNYTTSVTIRSYMNKSISCREFIGKITVSEVVKCLFENIRSNYPERKYHKKYEELDKSSKMNRTIQTFNSIRKCIAVLINNAIVLELPFEDKGDYLDFTKFEIIEFSDETVENYSNRLEEYILKKAEIVKNRIDNGY